MLNTKFSGNRPTGSGEEDFLRSPMLHTKFHENRPAGSGEEDF